MCRSYAGEDSPKCVIPTSYGYIPSGESGTEPQYHIGDNGPSVWRAGQSVLNPLRDGIVEDWDAAERLIQTVFEREMRLRKGPPRTLVLLGRPLTLNTQSLISLTEARLPTIRSSSPNPHGTRRRTENG